jgi:hypothetical protein
MFLCCIALLPVLVSGLGWFVPKNTPPSNLGDDATNVTNSTNVSSIHHESGKNGYSWLRQKGLAGVEGADALRTSITDGVGGIGMVASETAAGSAASTIRLASFATTSAANVLDSTGEQLQSGFKYIPLVGGVGGSVVGSLFRLGAVGARGVGLTADAFASATESIGEELSSSVRRTTDQLKQPVYSSASKAARRAQLDSQVAALSEEALSAIAADGYTAESWAQSALLVHSRAGSEATRQSGALIVDSKQLSGAQIWRRKASAILFIALWPGLVLARGFATKARPSVLWSLISFGQVLPICFLLGADNVLQLPSLTPPLPSPELPTRTSEADDIDKAPPLPIPSDNATAARSAEVKWINVALMALWSYTGAENGQSSGGIGAVLRNAVAEALATALETSSAKPGSVASVSVRRLDLGRAPPLFHSLQCIQHQAQHRMSAKNNASDGGSNEDGSKNLGPFLIFEADVGWAPPGFEVLVEVSSTRLARSALPRLAVRIADLKLRLKTRIAVELLPAPPFVGRVGFALASSPTLDLSLSPHFTGAIKPISNSHTTAGSKDWQQRLSMDVARLPVLRDWLHTVVMKSFAPYVEPGVVAFDLGAALATSPNASAAAVDEAHQKSNQSNPATS